MEQLISIDVPLIRNENFLHLWKECNASRTAPVEFMFRKGIENKMKRKRN